MSPRIDDRRLGRRGALGAGAACVALSGAVLAAEPLTMTYDSPSNSLQAKPAGDVPAAPPPGDGAASTQFSPSAAASGFPSERATFALSREAWHSDPEILWPGFLSGMRGFEHFYEPVGNPLYFESPFVNTSLRLLYLAHDFPDGSQLGGGNVNVYAAQVRVALTDRLAFIATKDGWSDLNASLLPAEEGWNDFAIGLKYAVIADEASDFVLTGGVRWEWENGDQAVLQGDSQEISPFLSFAKGFDRFHILGNITGRIPTDQDRGNNILSWDLHFDYEIAPETLPGFAPMIEIHGLHYLSDADHLPLSVGGYDYTNLGSFDVAGDGVVAMGLGFRWKLNPHLSLGSTWAFPLHNPDNDIMGNRVTVDLMLSW